VAVTCSSHSLWHALAAYNHRRDFTHLEAQMSKVLSDMKLSESHFSHDIEIPIEKVDTPGLAKVK
jgi:hypothetical protein